MDKEIPPNEDEQEVINQLLNDFDFASLAEFMDKKDWVYEGEKSPMKIQALKDTATYLILKVLREKDTKSLATGGFKVTYREDIDDMNELELIFEAESSSVYYTRKETCQ